VTQEEIMEIIKSATASDREAVRATTQLVLAAVKAAGAVSLMPAPHLPKSGLLLMVHPEVYEQVRLATKEEAA
jgi:predicted HAD superfamily Cof-like phosphohydrolase